MNSNTYMYLSNLKVVTNIIFMTSLKKGTIILFRKIPYKNKCKINVKLIYYDTIFVLFYFFIFINSHDCLFLYKEKVWILGVTTCGSYIRHSLHV